MNKLQIYSTGLILFCLATAAGADPGNGPLASQSFRDLLDCRQVKDVEQRLACYDQQSAIVAAATERREIVITEKGEIRQTRRKLFGFALPDASLLSRDDDGEETRRLETTVTSARRNRDGGWIVQLAEGSTWEQIDSKALALSPKNGQQAIVTKGALGSYFVSIDGQTAIKVRRTQ